MTSVHDPRSDEPRASDIPADIWAAADAVVSGLGFECGGPIHLAVARAIVAERERCAAILEKRRGLRMFDVPGDVRYLAEMAADLAIHEAVRAIRKPAPLVLSTFSGTLRYEADKAGGLVGPDGC